MSGVPLVSSSLGMASWGLCPAGPMPASSSVADPVEGPQRVVPPLLCLSRYLIQKSGPPWCLMRLTLPVAPALAFVLWFHQHQASAGEVLALVFLQAPLQFS